MIPIAKPDLGEAEATAARDAILSGWVTQGPQVALFEKEFAKFVGARFACAVSNCTAALQLALHGLGVGPGDEVITVSHSFIATTNAIVNCGATPVFVDIDPLTYNINPHRIESAITARTKAILPVHQMGLPANLDAVIDIATRHGLMVIEDAACAIGSSFYSDGNWQSMGQPHGQVACFSLHPRKVITTGEGGMLTTNDPELDRTFRLLRQHGMSLSDTARHTADKVVFESYLQVGFNYRMTDIQAAIGRVQLQRLPQHLILRNKIAQRYTKSFENIPGLLPPHVPEFIRFNYQSYALRVSPPFPLSRDHLMQRLLDSGIATRRGIMNAHQEPAYSSQPHGRLEQSELARDQVILLPLYATLTAEEQSHVINTIERIASDACVGGHSQ